MQRLLLALGLALVCGVQAATVLQPVEELNLQKVAGTWHSVAMAARDISLLLETGPLRVYVQELSPTPEGNLEVILSKREDGRCVQKKVMAEKTELPAEFKINTRTLKADKKVLEKFNRALQTLPVHIWLVFDLTQGAEQCRV
uniref:Lipocalin/cytosolic fatty-acid binding domain-containing protein n=1 Tax=Suricata suricatta TaxID=37032 RepID=A0A673U626_SURSU